MKFLIPDWKFFGKEDIQTSLEQMGHQVIFYKQEPRNYRRDPRFRSELRHFIKEQDVELIFSFNYYPILSTTCEELGMPYISWCYDSPLVMTYSDTIFNSCNYVFLFDSQMVMDLQKLGVTQVYYLPMAVNTERLAKLSVSEEDKKLITADVAFVGSLYNEKHNLYDRMENLSPHTRGYLEGVMQAQRMIYGYSFIENTLTEDILAELTSVMPLETNRDGHETLSYLYANYFLCRKMTEQDRMDILQALNVHPEIATKLYTQQPTPQFPNIKNMGTISYLDEMPLVFKHSKINLNITLRSIKNGIPLRAMDIMGAGGFLLTNYQSDFSMHFVEGQDYINYESIPDMMDKIQYFLNHENERAEIARNGFEKIKAEHTYQQRVEEILSVLPF